MMAMVADSKQNASQTVLVSGSALAGLSAQQPAVPGPVASELLAAVSVPVDISPVQFIGSDGTIVPRALLLVCRAPFLPAGGASGAQTALSWQHPSAGPPQAVANGGTSALGIQREPAGAAAGVRAFGAPARPIADEEDGPAVTAHRQRDSMVAAHLPAVITVFTLGGAVVHQNPASTKYLGTMPRAVSLPGTGSDGGIAGIGTGTGAAAGGLAGSGMAGGSMAGGGTAGSPPLLPPPTRAPTVTRAGGPQAAPPLAVVAAEGSMAAAAAAGGREGPTSNGAAGAGLSEADRRWLASYGVLGCIFAYEPAKLRQLLDVLMAGRGSVWQGIVRVPPSAELRQSLVSADAMRPAGGGAALASDGEGSSYYPYPVHYLPPPPEEEACAAGRLGNGGGAEGEDRDGKDAAAVAGAGAGGEEERGAQLRSPFTHAPTQPRPNTPAAPAAAPAPPAASFSVARAPSGASVSLGSGLSRHWSYRPVEQLEERPESGVAAAAGALLGGKAGPGPLGLHEGLAAAMDSNGANAGCFSGSTSAAIAAAGATVTTTGMLTNKGTLDPEADPLATSTWAVIAERKGSRPLSSGRAAVAAGLAQGQGRGSGGGAAAAAGRHPPPRFQHSPVQHGGAGAACNGIGGGGAADEMRSLGLARRCGSATTAAHARAHAAPPPRMRYSQSHTNFGTLLFAGAGAPPPLPARPAAPPTGSSVRHMAGFSAVRLNGIASPVARGGGGGGGGSGQSSPLHAPANGGGGGGGAAGSRRYDSSAGGLGSVAGVSRVLLFASSLRSAPFPPAALQAQGSASRLSHDLGGFELGLHGQVGQASRLSLAPGEAAAAAAAAAEAEAAAAVATLAPAAAVAEVGPSPPLPATTVPMRASAVGGGGGGSASEGHGVQRDVAVLPGSGGASRPASASGVVLQAGREPGAGGPAAPAAFSAGAAQAGGHGHVPGTMSQPPAHGAQGARQDQIGSLLQPPLPTTTAPAASAAATHRPTPQWRPLPGRPQAGSRADSGASSGVAATALGGGGGGGRGTSDAGGGGGAGSETWHEVSAVRAQDPVTGATVLVVTQVDVSAKVRAERHLVHVMCAERRLLLQLFPRHVLQHVVEANPLLTRAARPPSAALGGLGGEGGGEEGGPEPREWLDGGDWRPVLRDCDTLATLHPQATVMFADIAGFDDLCMELPPQQVLAFLNDLFAKFDSSIEPFGVHKMETIGGLFIVAGGLLIEEEDGAVAVRERWDPLHAEKVFMFAKAMLHVASKTRLPTSDEPVKLRIGLHTGPVMSGIVGTRVPRFVLFGDTVNTASRMQTSCTPGTIHVSEDTRALLPHDSWTPTGGMQIKGKGFLHTYVWQPEEPIHFIVPPPATHTATPTTSNSGSGVAAASVAGGRATAAGGRRPSATGFAPSMAAALLSTVGESVSCTSSDLQLVQQLSFTAALAGRQALGTNPSRAKSRMRFEARPEEFL